MYTYIYIYIYAGGGWEMVLGRAGSQSWGGGNNPHVDGYATGPTVGNTVRT
jgi:hypothetical protein